MGEFVEKESNIWACIYRSINRRRDNNDYDVENEGSKELLYQSFNNAKTHVFQKFAPLKGKEANCFTKPAQSHIDNSSVNEIREDEEEDDQDEQDVGQHIIISRFSSKNDPPDTVESSEIDSNLVRSNKKASSRKNSNITSNSRSGPHSQKTLPHFSSDIVTSERKNKPSADDFKEEEMMVIYYVSTVIRLSKISDGFKAIAQYEQKGKMSKLAEAHIYKLLGVLHMLSEEKDYHKAKDFFEKSATSFASFNCMRGFGITKLAILR